MTPAADSDASSEGSTPGGESAGLEPAGPLSAGRASADSSVYPPGDADSASPDVPRVAPGQVSRDLICMVVGGSPTYTRQEVASASRMTMDEVRRLWRAMGFPDVGDARAFTDADLEALLRVSSVIEQGVLDFDAVVEITRSLGQTTSRLAQWQVDAVGQRLISEGELQYSGESLSEQEWDLARSRLRQLLPDFERMLVYVWRRQLVATLERAVADFETPEEDATTGRATVGFADLVSFTRLSRQLGEDELSALVHTFETTAADLVHAAGARLVKTIGDEVMFVSDSVSAAAEIGLRLHEMSRNRAAVPQMRAGLATGVVVTRMGDVFGTTVNRASRLTAAARPGTTIVDGATVEALAQARDARFATRALTPRPIRGLGLIRPYALAYGELPIDERPRSGDVQT